MSEPLYIRIENCSESVVGDGDVTINNGKYTCKIDGVPENLIVTGVSFSLSGRDLVPSVVLNVVPKRFKIELIATPAVFESSQGSATLADLMQELRTEGIETVLTTLTPAGRPEVVDTLADPAESS